MSTEPMERQKLNRGFRVMDPERQREIARLGGAAVPAIKRSFSQNRSLAAEAGRRGGQNSVPRNKKPPDAGPSRPRPQNDFA